MKEGKGRQQAHFLPSACFAQVWRLRDTEGVEDVTEIFHCGVHVYVKVFVVTLNICRPRKTSGDAEIIFLHGILDFGHVPWINTNSNTFMNNLSFISDANCSMI